MRITADNLPAARGEEADVPEVAEVSPVRYRVAILHRDKPGATVNKWLWLADPLDEKVAYECILPSLAEGRAQDFVAGGWGSARIVTLRPSDCPRGILEAWNRSLRRG